MHFVSWNFTNFVHKLNVMADFLTILSDQKEELQRVTSYAKVSRIEESFLNLKSNLAQVVIGVRRSGKSTICQKSILNSGLPFGYVNFDDERLEDITANDFDSILKVLYRLNGDFNILFLDEAQDVKGWHLFVNRMLRSGLKVVLTGSNANLLSSELTTYLTGRYNEISLYPFSFVEYCQAENVNVSSQSTKSQALRLKALDEYMACGGLPEVIVNGEGKGYVMSLLNAIITKDIKKRHNIRYIETLQEIANNVLDKYCQEISFNDIAREFSLKSVHTAKKYVSYLEEAFLIRIIHKYSFKSSERTKNWKVYAVDLAFATNRTDLLTTENIGWRLENIVLLELLRRTDKNFQNIFYIKKERQFEVDFIVCEKNKAIELIQVAHHIGDPASKLYKREVGGLIKGSKYAKCSKLTLIVMEGERQTINEGGRTIEIIPASEWLCNGKNYR